MSSTKEPTESNARATEHQRVDTHNDDEHSRPPHPFVEASFLSKLLFIWPYRLMSSNGKARVATSSEGNETEPQQQRAAIEECDLPDVLPNDSSANNLHHFQQMWEAEVQRAARVKEYYLARQQDQQTNEEGKRQRNKKQQPRLPKSAYPSLHRAIITDYMKTMWYIQPFMGLSSTAKLVQALALGYLLQTFEVDDTDAEYTNSLTYEETSNDIRGTGYLWAGVLVLSGFIVLMEHHHVFFWTWRKGMQYRISSIAAVYDKSLRLNSTSATEQLPSKGKSSGGAAAAGGASSSGKIVNIATNDVERFLLASLFASYILWAPLQSIAILGLGWYTIGWSFAAGFGLLVFLFVPLQVWLSKKFAFMRSKIAAITDERVTMVSQAVSGVRVMKMSGWEDNFESRIAAIRKKEVDSIERVNTYRVMNEAIFFFCSVTTSVLIFIIHVGSGGILTPRIVFTTIVLINVSFCMMRFLLVSSHR